MHGVCGGLVFMHFTVCATGDAANALRCQMIMKDNFPRAEIGGDTRRRGKVVQPHCQKMQEVNQHLVW